MYFFFRQDRPYVALTNIYTRSVKNEAGDGLRRRHETIEDTNVNHLILRVDVAAAVVAARGDYYGLIPEDAPPESRRRWPEPMADSTSRSEHRR